MATVAPPTATSRRLPPPCWSNDETVALIDAYRHKWYSLCRGNLRAPHWQEVADAVAARCHSHPPKTAIQCRHKMEKLRKRYRAEVQRIRNPNPNYDYNNMILNKCRSSWVHFPLMNSMELGYNPSDRNNNQDDVDDEEEENQNDEGGDCLLYPNGIKQAITTLPVNSVISQPTINNAGRVIDDFPPSVRYGSGGSYSGGMKRKEEGMGDVMSEMVEAVQRLGDGFVKMERMKMEMAREIESMRMKMERKRTEMIIETQQKMWDSFVKMVMEEKKNKKVKREWLHQNE